MRKKNKKARRRKGTRPIQLVLGAHGESGDDGLFDDCPICQELRRSKDPIYTLNTAGRLVKVGGR